MRSVSDGDAGPDGRHQQRETIGLAFVAALQQLPARQRAAFVLHDVLGFSDAEVAETLGTTVASVSRVVRRGRATVGSQMPADRDPPPPPRSAAEHQIVVEFTAAAEGGDVVRIARLLTADATLARPPGSESYEGVAAIEAFLERRTVLRSGRVRLVPARANGQPAFGCYVRELTLPVARAAGLLVLTLEGDRISVLTGFRDLGLLLKFGLPLSLAE